MDAVRALDPASHLMIDEIAPVVDLASYWEFDRPQWHRYGLPGHHLLLVRQGRLEAVTDHGRVAAGAGSMLCFRPCALNQYGNHAAVGYYQIHLSFAPPPRHLHTPWLEGIGPLPLVVALGERQAAATACMEEAMALIESARAADRLRLRASVLSLLALIAESAPSRRRPPSTLDAWQEARRRLESDLAAELPLAEVAAALGIGADHFSRRFRARFGVSPGRARTQARLRLAAQLLRAGSAPIKAVARRVGIADANAFTRLFRRHFGLPPSALAHADAADPPSPRPGAGLVVNRHLVAPGMPTDWEARFRARR